MKNLRKFMALSAIVVLTSCSVSGPMLITDNKANEKRGVASYNVYLGFIRPMKADASIQTAAKNGGITYVATVDRKIKAGFFKATYSTVVTGS